MKLWHCYLQDWKLACPKIIIFVLSLSKYYFEERIQEQEKKDGQYS